MFVDSPGGFTEAFLNNFLLAEMSPDGKMAPAMAYLSTATSLISDGYAALPRFKIQVTENTLCS